MENKLRFNEPFEDQDWLDIGADLRIKIRKQFYQLTKEIEQLKAELKESNDSWQKERLSAASYQVIDDLNSEITELKSKLKIAKDALEFYASLADRLSVEYAYKDGTFAYHVVSDDRIDTLAKKALEEIGRGING